MGTQQFLLILFSLVVLGLIIYSGYVMMHNSTVNSSREQLISNLYDIGLIAQEYYKKTVDKEGENGSYTGWKLPDQFYYSTAGTFDVSIKDKRIDLSAVGTQIGRNNKTNVHVTASVDNKGIIIIVVN
jgi:hypothetical protein